MNYFKEDLIDKIHEIVAEAGKKNGVELDIQSIDFQQLSDVEKPRFTVNMDWVFSPDPELGDEEEICRKISNDLSNIKYGDTTFSLLLSYSDEGLGKIFALPMRKFLEKSQENFIQKEKERLRNLPTPNIYNNNEAVQKFAELADNQRGLPENQMLVCQRLMGGGVLPYQLEHIGDLTHRVAQSTYVETGLGIESSLNDIMPKIKSGIISLRSGYGFEKEHQENLKATYNFRYKSRDEYESFEDFKKEIDKQLLKYAEEHEKLEVYNEFQYYCREAAINLGKQRFDAAAENLEMLQDWIDRDLFLEKASGFEPNFKPEQENRRSIKLK